MRKILAFWLTLGMGSSVWGMEGSEELQAVVRRHMVMEFVRTAAIYLNPALVVLDYEEVVEIIRDMEALQPGFFKGLAEDGAAGDNLCIKTFCLLRCQQHVHDRTFWLDAAVNNVAVITSVLEFMLRIKAADCAGFMMWTLNKCGELLSQVDVALLLDREALLRAERVRLEALVR